MNKVNNRTRVGWRREKDNFIYYFKKSLVDRYGLNKIRFVGFKKRPVGLSLYESGGGFNVRQSNKIGGDLFLRYLAIKYKRKLRLNIYGRKDKIHIFKISKSVLTVALPFDDFLYILKNLGDEVIEKRNSIIEKRLTAIFPKSFKDVSLKEETVALKLENININKLEIQDHKAIGNFIRRYISFNFGDNETLAKLHVNLIIKGRKKTLDQVIKKFERYLRGKKYTEKKWQKFLHEEVFFFMSSYVESIREADVNFGRVDEGEKKPDFVWIDIYGFLDVFEIKTPNTDILARRIDKNHKNYYFSTEASKAISQIEKYIMFLEKNVEGFEKYLSRKTKIPFSVLKPKAFLIIGDSKEFDKDQTKKRDFRLLRRLFKNIEFITFNELLDNLRNLSTKFEKEE